MSTLEIEARIDTNKLFKDVVSAMGTEKQKRKFPLKAAKYEVGLDELGKDFHRHCQRNGEIRDKIIGIYVLGSGKTTLAKYLFNRKLSEFSRSIFLFDLRRKHVEGELTSLQSRLLSDPFPENHPSFSSIEEKANYMKLDLQKNLESKLLVVLDDVYNQSQLSQDPRCRKLQDTSAIQRLKGLKRVWFA